MCVGVVGWLPIGILSQYVLKRLAPNLGSDKTRTLVFTYFFMTHLPIFLKHMGEKDIIEVEGVL